MVVLTLLERPDTNPEGVLVPTLLFGLTTLVTVAGIFILISRFAFGRLDEPTAGVSFVGAVAAPFVVAIAALISGAFVPSTETRLFYNVGLLLVTLVLPGIVFYLLWKYGRRQPPDD